MQNHRHRHDPSKTLVGFTVGDVHYAVAIAEVREICNPKVLVPLPHAPASVPGVADYRGDVIPVLDLRMRFGLPPAPQSRRIKWIVVDVGGRFVALIVDQTLGVFGTAGAGLRPAPPLGEGEDLRGIEGVATHDDELVFVLRLRSFADLTAHLALPASILPAASPDPRAGRSMAQK
jgi:purine-binding chemotaxis protein CheW